MDSKQEKRAQEIIDSQLAMSGTTLAKLMEAGLTDETTSQIEFSFKARNKADANALINHLKENDCLELSLIKTGSLFSSQFNVTGKSHPTAITIQVISSWLPWMVVQGILYNCEFDGWGAEV